jgi:dipeptidyl aminopeptidase/acylaminoacyl peptidase
MTVAFLCATEPAFAVPDVNLEEKLLATVPEGVAVYAMHFRPDGGSVLFVCDTGGSRPGVVDRTTDKIAKLFVVDNGVRSAEFDAFIQEITFTPDKKRYGYIAWNGETRHVVVDGKRQEQFDSISEIHFSGDGKRVAYVNWLSQPNFVVVDGKKDEPVDNARGFLFSSDGVRYAYEAEKDGKQFVVVDGNRGSPYDQVGCLRFSPKDNRVGYIASRDKKWVIVVDGIAGPEFDGIGWRPKSSFLRGGLAYSLTLNGFAFSPDGTRTAYVAARDGKRFVVVDGVKGEAFDQEECQPVFSPDSTRVAYRARHGKRWSLIVNGMRMGEEWPDLGNPTFSPDGKRLAYTGMESKDRWFPVIDGERKGETGRYFAATPTFSPDSKRVVCIVHKGEKSAVMVDDVIGPEWDEVYSPTFSPDSKRVAYFAKQRRPWFEKGGEWFLVVDGIRKSETFDFIYEAAFSPDGTKVVFGARKGRELWWKVVDVASDPNTESPR